MSLSKSVLQRTVLTWAFLLVAFPACSLLAQESTGGRWWFAPLDQEEVTLEDELGVWVTDSPGVGVRVDSVTLHSPAGHAGIRTGDYVMAVNDRPIEDPDSLQDAVREDGRSDKLKIVIWRNGRERKMKVKFPNGADDVDLADRPWLGVVLEGGESEGAVVSQVISDSPAEQMGLSAGDRIVAFDGEPIQSADDLVDSIEELTSGEEVELTIDEDPPRVVSITLGSVAEAPALFRRPIPVPEREWFPDQPGWPPAIFPGENWQDAMSVIREEIRELHQQLRRIQNGKTEDSEPEPDAGQEPGDGETGHEARGKLPQRLAEPGFAEFLAAPPASFVHDDGSARHHRSFRYSYGAPYRAYPGYRYGAWRYPYSYRYYGGRPVFRSYYGPYYRSYYRPYYRSGVGIYVGPRGFRYYYR